MLLLLLACTPDDDAKTCDAPSTCDGRDVVACDAVVDTCGDGTVCADAVGCTACVATFSAATLDLVVVDEALAFSQQAAMTVDLAGDAGTVTLSAPAGVVITDASGAAVSSFTADQLPATVYVHATAVGTGTIEATFSGGATPCDSAASVTVTASEMVPFVGRPRTAAPGWETARSFLPDEAIYAVVDPSRWASAVGTDVDVYVTAHREADAWAADATLTDVTGVVERATVAADGLTMIQAWDSPQSDTILTHYDVVIDADRDGTLSAGDRFMGPAGDTVVVFTDLTATGPHAVDQADYDGDFMEDKRVYWPTDLASLGPRPLLVISHGNGHQYTWYDYLGEHLASWGYVVMTHENNTQPGIETASRTTLSNTDAFLGDPGAVDSALTDLVDATRIGWIGHSRGGEGVVRAYDRLVDADVDPPDNYAIEDVRFISSIAPTVFNEVTDSDPHDRPYHLLAGTSDGDVTGSIDCPQCQFFRIWEQGIGPKMASYVVGASHNDFNCCGFDDGMGPDLIGRDAAQTVAKGYYLALAAAYLDDEDAALDVFRRMYDGFHPGTFGADVAVAALYRDAHALGTPIIDDFQSESDEDVSSSGGAVSTDADVLREGQLKDADSTYTWRASDPMNGMTHAVMASDVGAGLALAFTGGTGLVRFEVPTDLADARSMGVVSFAVAQTACHEYTLANAPFGFTVTLEDAAGARGSVDFSDQGLVPMPYERANCSGGKGFANEMVTVRIALADFTLGNTLDLGQLAAIELDFAAGVADGAVVIDNVELSP